MIIDVHGHLVPPDLLAAIRKESRRFPSLRLIEDGASLAVAFAGGKPSRPIMKGLGDVVGRLAWMDKQGIDHHVTPSPHTVFGQKGSGESGYLGAPAAIASAVNDAVRPLGIVVNSLPIKMAQLADMIAAARGKSDAVKEPE